MTRIREHRCHRPPPCGRDVYAVGRLIRLRLIVLAGLAFMIAPPPRGECSSGSLGAVDLPGFPDLERGTAAGAVHPPTDKVEVARRLIGGDGDRLPLAPSDDCDPLSRSSCHRESVKEREEHKVGGRRFLRPVVSRKDGGGLRKDDGVGGRDDDDRHSHGLEKDEEEEEEEGEERWRQRNLIVDGGRSRGGNAAAGGGGGGGGGGRGGRGGRRAERGEGKDAMRTSKRRRALGTGPEPFSSSSTNATTRNVPLERVVGGAAASATDFPYQVAILLEKGVQFQCGGAIIDPFYVITAAATGGQQQENGSGGGRISGKENSGGAAIAAAAAAAGPNATASMPSTTQEAAAAVAAAASNKIPPTAQAAVVGGMPISAAASNKIPPTAQVAVVGGMPISAAAETAAAPAAASPGVKWNAESGSAAGVKSDPSAVRSDPSAVRSDPSAVRSDPSAVRSEQPGRPKSGEARAPSRGRKSGKKASRSRSKSRSKSRGRKSGKKAGRSKSRSKSRGRGDTRGTAGRGGKQQQQGSGDKKKKKRKSKKQREAERKAEQERLAEEARRAEEARILREEEDERRRVLEEELAQQAEAARLVAEAERLAKEREEVKPLLRRREDEILHELTIAREKRDWEHYLACDPIPEPSIEPELTTYISEVRRSDVLDLKSTMDLVQQVYQVRILTQNILLDAEAKEDHRLIKKYAEYTTELKNLIDYRIDKACANLLLEAEEIYHTSGENIFTASTPNLRIGLWINHAKNPRLKTIEFPAIGAALEIPKSLALANVAIRVQQQDIDHLVHSSDKDASMPIGGLITTDVLAVPPAPKVIKGWKIRQITPMNTSVVKLPYPIPPAGADEATVASLQAPKMGFRVQLPPRVVVPGKRPGVASWDPDECKWKTEPISDITYDESSRTLHFQSIKIKTLAMVQPRVRFIPYSYWAIRPTSESTAIMVLHAGVPKVAEVKIEIGTGWCKLINPVYPECKELVGIPFSPRVLLKRLSESGVHLMPKDEDMQFVTKDLRVKDAEIEKYTCRDMALLAPSFTIGHTRWNRRADDDTCLIRVLEIPEYKFPRNIDKSKLSKTIMYKLKGNIMIDINEKSSAFRQDPLGEYHASLMVTIKDHCNEESMDKIKRGSAQFTDCVKQLAYALRLLSFGYTDPQVTEGQYRMIYV
ncbi:hypothetical protein CBR_g36580 [Chara braunii]|uniref:IC97/Casc1 N-terminal domain-containing protein n=1 Tax=Chara braunii TaxID=69332 RepID=A0A388JZG4_CHABU|nr:hypothetical protein CBR_g36580 [Chara braunii]|eukprot:GBG63093.1 hypothetical protein CBR_g36580 [Chara braunii]